MDATWYLGPLGDLRELVCPEPDMTLSQETYGGVHQGLSGARSYDFTGTKARYEFEIKHMTQDEYRWLHALNTRMVPGPYYLLDPLKKNRMSVQGCKMTRPLVQYPQLKYQLSYDRPAAVGLPIQSLHVQNWTAYPDVLNINFDRGYVIPVRPSETITASVFMKASASATGRLCLDYIDATGTTTQTYSETKTTVTGWQRNSLTRLLPAGVCAVRFYYQTAVPRTELMFSAPQVEPGSVATEWEIGGAANTVIMESLDTTSHIFPLRSSSVTLLEA